MKPFEPQRLPLEELDWKALIPLLGRANRSLAYFDGIIKGTPGADVLLAPLTTREAVLSSKLEGTQATLGEVLKYEAGEEPEEAERRKDIGEIINYRHALRRAVEVLETKPFHLNLLLELHGILLDSVRGRDKDPGRFRTAQNYIGAPGTPIEAAFFVPPSHLELPAALDNWEKYYHMDEPDPLGQLAVLHAQFEILHPFMDGNGRIGRMLVPLFLYEKKIISKPVFYVSAYLEAHREAYCGQLRPLGVQPGAWQRWAAFFLEALDAQAKANAATAEQILDLYASLKERVITLTRSQYAVPLLDHMFAQPVFQATHLADRPNMPSYPSIFNILKALKKDGVLKTVREGRGRRPHVLALASLVNLCEGREVL